MKCSGLHCPGCGHHGGKPGAGAGAVLALVVLAVIAAHRRTIGHAASVAVHVLEVAAEVAAGLAVAAGITAAVLIIRRRAVRRSAMGAARERAEIPPSVRVLGLPRRAPAELPAAGPAGASALAAHHAEQDASPVAVPAPAQVADPPDQAH
jgi:MYXO-CTERM domain-containing protein